MKKQTLDLQTLTMISLFAALIFLSIQFFKIPVGAQFIHFGNALVVVGCLIFGSKLGFLAAAIGLGIFDLLNGYAAEIPVILLEALAVAVVIHFLYEGLFQGKDRLRNILVTAVVAALVKIVLNILKYTLTGTLFGGSSLPAAFLLAVAEITGTFGSSLATVIAVPILYPIFKQVRKAHKHRRPLKSKDESIISINKETV
ncbi:ECF transporter S component [Streptococcus sanguinis]|uniref:ECF transporter S component n=1 Tax=Streptococcus sanguinis TaxID=1305 RepID=UPI0003D383C3|nr:ECF transporter S component [Streptococcus sanguinis]ETD07897.1 hypothetical protein HMPREF1196_00953 [Streptococcus sanguinis CC94A]